MKRNIKKITKTEKKNKNTHSHMSLNALFSLLSVVGCLVWFSLKKFYRAYFLYKEKDPQTNKHTVICLYVKNQGE